MLLLTGALVTGCGEGSTDPAWLAETRLPSELNILEFEQPAQLVADSVSFWAVKGEDRFVEMFLADDQGQPAERILRFEVNKKALDRYPDGRKFKGSDSVLIVVRITDPVTLEFDFEPSGLRFKSKDPALLTINYGLALSHPTPVSRHDDDEDSIQESDLGIWVQETTGGEYTRISTSVRTHFQDAVGSVLGFSKYAVAY